MGTMWLEGTKKHGCTIDLAHEYGIYLVLVLTFLLIHQCQKPKALQVKLPS